MHRLDSFILTGSSCWARQTIRTQQGQRGCLHCDSERQRLWGPPEGYSSVLMEDSHPGLLSLPAGMVRPSSEVSAPTSLQSRVQVTGFKLLTGKQAPTNTALLDKEF